MNRYQSLLLMGLLITPHAVCPRQAFAQHHSAAAHPPAAAVLAANRAATREPEAGAFEGAVQVYRFSAGSIYHVPTAPGRITDIALEAGETLGAVASGDTLRWVIGDTASGEGAEQRTHVLVKPTAAGLSTNLVITTDRRSYHLSLTSADGPALAGLSWSYPRDALIALKRSASNTPDPAPRASGLDLDQLDFSYAIRGDHPDWRPLRAFDDHRQTFIEFPEALLTSEAPPLFVVGKDGEPQLVNYRVKGRFYIVDRLFGTAELRLGARHPVIVRIERLRARRKSGRKPS